MAPVQWFGHQIPYSTEQGIVWPGTGIKQVLRAANEGTFWFEPSSGRSDQMCLRPKESSSPISTSKMSNVMAKPLSCNLPQFRYDLFGLVSLSNHSFVLLKWDIPIPVGGLIHGGTPKLRQVEVLLK